MSIRNPLQWGVDQVRIATAASVTAGDEVRRTGQTGDVPLPRVARIGFSDLKDALTKGVDDFTANRTDVLLLCVIYPVIGLMFGRLASGAETFPLLFPLASGFALVGPVAAVGLYEMSRRRELGAEVSWADAFGVVRSRAFGAILLLGLVLMAIFVLWMLAADAIYTVTLGPEHPASVGAFLHDVFATSAGWTLIVLGVGVGFAFAALVLAIGVFSFPLLLDRNVGVETAVWTSVRAVAANPVPMAAWGAIVAAALVVGSIPLFLGLVIVLPVLGHATWHLYRRLMPR